MCANRTTWWLILLFVLSPIPFASEASDKREALEYCTGAKSIDLFPFRAISDGKELAYLLLLTRSYISSDPLEQGILDAYHFSPDGRRFRGRVGPAAVWQDGTPLNAAEAAAGISRSFPHRPIGERVRVVRTTIVSEREFELEFSSSIENLTGTVREALSNGSRHNRIWPARLEKLKGDQYVKGAFDLVSKYSLRLDAAGTVIATIEGQEVSIPPADVCRTPSHFLYPELNKRAVAEFSTARAPLVQSAILQLNTSSKQGLSIVQRRQLAAWIRGAFRELAPENGVVVTDSHFLPGEPGHSSDSSWQSTANAPIPRFGRPLRIAAEVPVYRKALENQAKKDGVSVEIVSFPVQTPDIDAQVLSAGNHSGRQVILQDLLSWPHCQTLASGAPATTKALMKIAEMSASTIPPDNVTLASFESAALGEMSIAPIGRRHVLAFSHRNSPLTLAWTPSMELRFVRRE